MEWRVAAAIGNPRRRLIPEAIGRVASGRSINKWRPQPATPSGLLQTSAVRCQLPLLMNPGWVLHENREPGVGGKSSVSALTTGNCEAASSIQSSAFENVMKNNWNYISLLTKNFLEQKLGSTIKENLPKQVHATCHEWSFPLL